MRTPCASGRGSCRYLQQITVYVDTKDRDAAAAVSGRPARTDSPPETVLGMMQQQVAVLSGSSSGCSNVRRVRMPQAKRRPPRRHRTPAPASHAERLQVRRLRTRVPRLARSDPRSAGCVDAPYFDGAQDVLDVGCGRGEFVELLRDRGISARGLELNHEMAEVCRGRGLDVTEGDAVAYLESLPDWSLADCSRHRSSNISSPTICSASGACIPSSPAGSEDCPGNDQRGFVVGVFAPATGGISRTCGRLAA